MKFQVVVAVVNRQLQWVDEFDFDQFDSELLFLSVRYFTSIMIYGTLSLNVAKCLSLHSLNKPVRDRGNREIQRETKRVESNRTTEVSTCA
jgi:hypothetical protein